MATTRERNELTATQIAEILGTDVIGDGTRGVRGFNVIERAAETDVAFVGCEKNLKRAATCEASVVIAPNDCRERFAAFEGVTFIPVDQPEVAFLKIAERLIPARPRANIGISPKAIVADTAVIGSKTNIHPLAVIGDYVEIGDNCDIGPGAVIGDGCTIGDDTAIDAHAVLYPDTVVGSRVKILAQAVIGAAGFGYRLVDGRHELLPHLGIVRIADDVEIGACTTIDRAKVGETTIAEGTRIDNLVMIAHNCQIGKHNLIIGQTGIAGSSSTGSYVVCAGQAGIADHVHLGDRAVIGAKTGVHRDMPGDKAYLGIPARSATLHAREQMALKRLPEMRSTVKQMEKQIAELQGQVATLVSALANSTSTGRSDDAGEIRRAA